MGSLRTRGDLIEAIEWIDGMVPPPLVEVDQLLSALLLIAGGDDYLEAMPAITLDDEEMAMWMDRPAVTDFIASIENAGD